MPEPPIAERRALGDLIRAERAKRRLTQEQLAERAGYARKFVSDIETGARRATLDGVFAVARALDIPLSELIAQVEREVAHARSSRRRSRSARRRS